MPLSFIFASSLMEVVYHEETDGEDPEMDAEIQGGLFRNRLHHGTLKERSDCKMLIYSETLTKEEFCNVTHTDPNSKLFDLLGKTAFFMRMPYDSEKPIIWYHCGTHEYNIPYFGNFEVHEDKREVWVDFNKEIAVELDLEPRYYGTWFLWSKY